MLTAAEKEALLQVAREAIEAAVRQQAYAPPPPDSPRLQEPRGAFVTLKVEGNLRGCIGLTESPTPLVETVARMARAAALEDPRFTPVGPDELEAIDVEISALTPMTPLRSPEDIEVGRHGLMIRHAGRSGLLLPQVPVEWGWDREDFLVHVCRKAGLPDDAWRSAELLTFEAEVFGEAEDA
jgi:AmmeMemoRadiSam system protein A